MPLPPTPRPPRLSRSGLILLVYGTLGLAAIAWGAVRGRPNIFLGPNQKAWLAVDWGRAFWGVGFGAVTCGLTVFLSRWAEHRFEWARTLDREFRAILGPLTGGEILVLAAASSVGEEAFFRGALLPETGLLWSSAIFALPHVGPGTRFLPWTLSSFVAGLAFGGLFQWSGTLAGPILAHFLINWINLRHITGRTD